MLKVYYAVAVEPEHTHPAQQYIHVSAITQQNIPRRRHALGGRPATCPSRNRVRVRPGRLNTRWGKAGSIRLIREGFRNRGVPIGERLLLPVAPP